MGELDIVPLDPADPDAMAAWYAVYFASATFERPHSTPRMLQEMRAQFQAENPGQRVLGWTGLVERRVAVVGSMLLPLKDNLRQVWIDVNTLPVLRNRGAGSQMLDHLFAVSRQCGRSLVATEAAYPYDGPPDGAGHHYVEFLLRRGFRFGLGDVMRVLDLPADEKMLRGFADEAAPHHEDYEIRQFVGPVPDDIIDSFGQLIGSLNTQAPTGKMELESEVFDAERIRADERVFMESGRTKYTTVAIARGGTLAAYSELVVPRHDPGRAYQWGTLVLPEHRGHRLGFATKARNLLWLQRKCPSLRILSTYNAEVNLHMVELNSAMGFRPVERLGELQRNLENELPCETARAR
ncbi:MAG TPA: hypothetical protein VFD59_18895 [Nocardioidaceae bacterium]|nr:hypothetical protein [Nocardioidaceae bacterium]